ncbi:MAG: transcriptional regulator [Candidatus Jordarchaeum sp.]|uniref:transcriptional regulator n=1 Tax=Candidatus Jordarchaeum sp. TaxID=2823881 RepID=UPI0040491B72
MESWNTRRERIVKILNTSYPVSLEDLCQELRVFDKRIVLEDLHHIALTLKKKNIKLVMMPPSCSRCGFIFKDLKKLKMPSRCPRCKNERISSPLFQIQ